MQMYVIRYLNMYNINVLDFKIIEPFSKFYICSTCIILSTVLQWKIINHFCLQLFNYKFILFFVYNLAV